MKRAFEKDSEEVTKLPVGARVAVIESRTNDAGQIRLHVTGWREGDGPQKTKKNRGWTSLEAANGAKLLDKTELSCALAAFLMPLRRLLLLDAADPLDPAMDLVYLLTSCMFNVRSLQRSALRGRGAWGDP